MTGLPSAVLSFMRHLMSEICFVLTSVQCVCVCVCMETVGRQRVFRGFVPRGRTVTRMNLKRFGVNDFHGYECKKGSLFAY